MQGREALHQRPAEVRLTAHEHALPGNEHVFEDDQGLAADHAEFHVSRVDAPFDLPLLVGLTAEDERDSRGIERDRGDDGVVLVAGPHGLRGHDHDLVAVDGPRLVRLGAADDHPVAAFFDHPREEVGIGLRAGPLGPIALGIRHPPHEHEVLLLDLLEILLEPREVGRPVLLVDLVGGHVHGIEGVEAHAALVAARRFVRDEPQHLHLPDQVVDALMDVGKPADFPAREMALRRHQVLVLRHQGQLVGLGRRVDVGDEARVGAAVLDGLAVVVDDELLVLEALHVIRFRNDFLHFSPHFMSFMTISSGATLSSLTDTTRQG